jgi:gas vesicle protein GvpA/GvpJ/GvpM family
MTATTQDANHHAYPSQNVALVDLLDRVMCTGVVVTGEITLSIADVDLVYISLNALISSIRRGGPGPITRQLGEG